jgi:hypothetical protein
MSATVYYASAQKPWTSAIVATLSRHLRMYLILILFLRLSKSFGLNSDTDPPCSPKEVSKVKPALFNSTVGLPKCYDYHCESKKTERSALLCPLALYLNDQLVKIMTGNAASP